MILLSIVLLLKLVASIYAFKNKLFIPGAFLATNLFCDITCQITNYLYQGYPKPLVGVGFILFAISVVSYLMSGVSLMFTSAMSVNNLTVKQVAPLLLISAAMLVLAFYPGIIGLSLVNLFLGFYACIAMVSIIVISQKLFQQPSLTKVLMFMLNLGCLIEILIVKMFGFQYYWLVNVSNCIFYLVILASCALVPKYRNLLSP